MIGNIIIVIVALAISLPCLFCGIVSVKDIPLLGIQLIIYGLIIIGVAAKIVGI